MTSPAASLRAVVFDLDGTLIESRGDIAAAVNHALVVSGRAPLPEDTIAGFIGDGARSLLARAANLAEDAGEMDALLEAYGAHYLAHPADATRWIDGALEAVTAIRDELELPVALCTNKTRSITDRVLAVLKPPFRFGAIYGGGDGPEKKPSPEPLFVIARALGVAPSSLVMVGDGPQDVLAARAAGARSVGVVTREPMSARLLSVKPDESIRSMSELPSMIRRLR